MRERRPTFIVREECFLFYERTGVSQYWIVHPVDKTVMVFMLDERNQYSKPSVFGAGEQMRVEQLNGLVIDLATVFK